MIRDVIIKTLKEELEKDKDIFALWLEGADSLGTVDSYSDIDLVLDVQDDKEERVFLKIESILQSFNSLDLNWEAPQPTANLRYKVFHIKETSEHLFIDVNIQSHSRKFKFIDGNPFEKPLVLFDKNKVINFKKVNEEELKEILKEQLLMIEALFFQRSKVKKSILRQEYLEAFAYYQKYVLDPLITLLRIIHTPLIAEYGLVHISQHIPKESLHKLEKLYQISSLKDLGSKFQDAEQWFKDLQHTVKKQVEK